MTWSLAPICSLTCSVTADKMRDACTSRPTDGCRSVLYDYMQPLMLSVIG